MADKNYCSVHITVQQKETIDKILKSKKGGNLTRDGYVRNSVEKVIREDLEYYKKYHKLDILGIEPGTKVKPKRVDNSKKKRGDIFAKEKRNYQYSKIND